MGETGRRARTSRRNSSMRASYMPGVTRFIKKMFQVFAHRSFRMAPPSRDWFLTKMINCTVCKRGKLYQVGHHKTTDIKKAPIFKGLEYCDALYWIKRAGGTPGTIHLINFHPTSATPHHRFRFTINHSLPSLPPLLKENFLADSISGDRLLQHRQ